MDDRLVSGSWPPQGKDNPRPQDEDHPLVWLKHQVCSNKAGDWIRGLRKEENGKVGYRHDEKKEDVSKEREEKRERSEEKQRGSGSGNENKQRNLTRRKQKEK